MQAPLPVDADTYPFDPGRGLELESVSCSTAGNCSAVGDYRDEDAQVPGLLLTQTNGQWAPGVRARLPAGAWGPGGANIHQSVNLQAVSCSSPGNCSAIGTYMGNRLTGHPHRYGGLLLNETDGQWAAGITAPLPADADSHHWISYTEEYLNSVSCSSPGNCTAVGDYLASHGHTEGLLLTQTDGVWASGVEARLPRGAWRSSPGPAVTLKSVSCASAGNCTAVGGYVAGKGSHISSGAGPGPSASLRSRSAAVSRSQCAALTASRWSAQLGWRYRSGRPPVGSAERFRVFGERRSQSARRTTSARRE